MLRDLKTLVPELNDTRLKFVDVEDQPEVAGAMDVEEDGRFIEPQFRRTKPEFHSVPQRSTNFSMIPSHQDSKVVVTSNVNKLASGGCLAETERMLSSAEKITLDEYLDRVPGGLEESAGIEDDLLNFEGEKSAHGSKRLNSSSHHASVLE